MWGSGVDSVIGGAYTQVLARTFAEQGIGTLAYDKRGTGDSGGAYTGGDFAALAEDAAHLIRWAQSLPQAESVGVWASSQAAWIIPQALTLGATPRFVVLASPPGVNPYEQVSHFLHQQTLSWGLTEDEAAHADRMHRAVALYYAGRASHRSAQAEVNRHRGARWFNTVVTHPYWDEMTPEGVILTPAALRSALRERPHAFEIYREASSFQNFTRLYRQLRRVPTLVIYGADDPLLPVDRSRAVFERALRGERRHPHDFRVYEGADHNIQTPDGRVRADYLEEMTAWARAQFASAG